MFIHDQLPSIHNGETKAWVDPCRRWAISPPSPVKSKDAVLLLWGNENREEMKEIIKNRNSSCIPRNVGASVPVCVR